MTAGAPLHLFEGYGVEVEYMIVDQGTLSIAPAAEEVLAAVAGEEVAREEVASEVEVGALSWSNELALHLIEIKTTTPVRSLDDLVEPFQEAVDRINDILRPRGACLLPTAMHPWMDPRTETQLWAREYGEVYRALDRIFDCRRHGWANLQSVHLNLSFEGDEEFARLHAATRLVLPLLPALAASSPVVNRELTGLLDNRLEVYRTNAIEIPSITGEVIPEAVYSRGDYEREIFTRIYRDIAPFDPEGLLRHEWLNARGAIARFDRGSIEIRVLDAQECPAADLALVRLVALVIEALVNERWTGAAAQRLWPAARLAAILHSTAREAEAATIADGAYRESFGMAPGRAATAGEMWWHLAEELLPRDEKAAPWAGTVRAILRRGTLARSIVRALGTAPSRERLESVYRDLRGCLDNGELFFAAGA